MKDLLSGIRRVSACILAAAMVFTSLPVNTLTVYADTDQTVVTITRDDGITSYDWCEADSNGQPIDGGASGEGVTDSETEVTIGTYHTIRVYNIEYVNGHTFPAFERWGDNNDGKFAVLGETKRDENDQFPVFCESTGSAELKTVTYPASRVHFSDLTEDSVMFDLTFAPESIEQDEDDGLYYVKRDTDLELTVTPTDRFPDNSEITGLSYTYENDRVFISSGADEKDGYDNTYVINDYNIDKAVLYDSDLTVSVGTAEQYHFTVRKSEGVSSVSYIVLEYTTEGYKPADTYEAGEEYTQIVFDDDDAAGLDVWSYNCVAFRVTCADGEIMTSHSFAYTDHYSDYDYAELYVDDSEDLRYGSYMLYNIDRDLTIDIDPYDPVPVVTEEATVPSTVEGEDDIAITKTVLSGGIFADGEGGVLTGRLDEGSKNPELDDIVIQITANPDINGLKSIKNASVSASYHDPEQNKNVRLTVKKQSTNVYNIPASEAEEAVECGDKITVTVKADAVMSNSFLISVPKDCGAEGAWISYSVSASTPPSESMILFNPSTTLPGADPDRLYSEVSVPDGASVTLKGFFMPEELSLDPDETRDPWTYFCDVTLTGPDSGAVSIPASTDPKGEICWNLGRISAGSTVDIETAELTMDQIGYKEDKADGILTDSWMSQEKISDGQLYNKDGGFGGTSYILPTSKGFRFFVVTNLLDKPKMIIPETVSYSLAGKSPVNLGSAITYVNDNYGNPRMIRYYEIPYNALCKAAFAVPVITDGKAEPKINIIVKLVQNGYYDQKILSPESDAGLVDYTINGRITYPRELKTYGADKFYTSDVTYGDSVTVKAVPKHGAALKAVYLITASEKKEIDESGPAPADLLECYKAKATSEGRKYEPGNDGIVTIPRFKVIEDYYLYAEEDTDNAQQFAAVYDTDGNLLEPVNSPEEGDDPSTYVPVYDVMHNGSYMLRFMNGSKPLTMSEVNAYFTGDQNVINYMVFSGTTTMTDGVLFKPSATSSGSDVYGKSVKIEISTAEYGCQTFILNVSKSIRSYEIYFPTGSMPDSYLPIPLGGTKSYNVALSGNSNSDIYVTLTEKNTGKSMDDLIWCSTEPVFVEEGSKHVEYTKLTIHSRSSADLLENHPVHELKFFDSRTDEFICSYDVKVIDQVMDKSFSLSAAEPGTSEPGTVVPDYNSFTVYFPEIDGLDTSVSGLYYRVLLYADSDDTGRFLESTGSKLVPVSHRSVNIRVASSPDIVNKNTVPYRISVQLAQVEEGREEEFRNNETEPIKSVFAEGLYVTCWTVPWYEETISAVENDLDVSAYATSVKLTASKSSKKIYTGMDPVSLASITYKVGKKQPANLVKQLKKAEITNTKSGMMVASTEWPESAMTVGGANDDQTTVTLDPSGLPAGRYRLTIYAKVPFAVTGKGKDVTDSFTFNVYEGIGHVKVSLPTNTLYKDKKNAPGLKPKASFRKWENGAEVAATPGNKSLKWYLVDTDYDPEKGIPGTGDLFKYSGISVNSKTGAVKVKKNTRINGDGVRFRLAAVPADYTHPSYYNGIGVSEVITVCTQPALPAHIFVGNIEIMQGGSYPAAVFEDMICGDMSDDADDCGVVARDKNGFKLYNIAFSATGLKIRNGKLTVSKTTNKASITAKPADGSGKKNALTVKFSIVDDVNTRIDLYDHTGRMIAGSGQLKNTCAPGYPMTLAIRGSNGSLVSNSVKVTGGKVTNSKTSTDGFGSEYVINPTAHKTVIRVTDKSAGKTYTYNVINTKIASSKTKTKVKAANYYDLTYEKGKNNKGNIFCDLSFGNVSDYQNEGDSNCVRYTVYTGKKKMPGKSRVIIRVTKDINHSLEDMFTQLFEPTITDLGGDEGYLAILDGDGSFTIDYIDADGNFRIPAGKYAISVTPVDDHGNAIAKTAVFKFKAAKAPKVKNLKLKKSVFNKFGYEQVLDVNMGKVQNIACRYGYPLYEIGGTDGPDLKGINDSGSVNFFATRFELANAVDQYGDPSGDICLRALTVPENIKGYTAKKGIQGYVAITYRQLNGEWKTQYKKVTVKGVTGPDN